MTGTTHKLLATLIISVLCACKSHNQTTTQLTDIQTNDISQILRLFSTDINRLDTIDRITMHVDANHDTIQRHERTILRSNVHAEARQDDTLTHQQTTTTTNIISHEVKDDSNRVSFKIRTILGFLLKIAAVTVALLIVLHSNTRNR